MIEFGRETCADLGEATNREWLETNGLGGYASSTVAGLNTRRYHGLLVAATRPPVGRIVLLSKFEETLVGGGQRFDLSANEYPGGVIHPRGHEYLIGFRLDPFPVFTYLVANVEIEKSVFMVRGENTTVVRYEFKVQNSEFKEAGDASSLIPHPSSLLFEVRPLVACRDYHATARENDALDPRVVTETSLITFKPYEEMPALHLAHDDACEVETAGFWYRDFVYAEERARGFGDAEDLFSPCALKFDLRGRSEVNVIASTARQDISRAGGLREAEVARRESVLAQSPVEDEFVRALVAAADSYVVARGENKTVIAGYHWFSDWGRDTMIALPGLTLVTRRFDDARSILAEFAKYADQGMLPNRFPDAGESPDYNTADATLWYFEAVRAFVEHTNDDDFVRAELYDVLADIIAWHVRGTRFGIRVDEADGLLSAGEAGAQLTWMDAKVGEWVVTPRAGKAVEIQALWYNALRVMEDLARAFGDEAGARKYALMSARARESFNELFWNEEAGCLYDVIRGETRDASIRPNQIFAASLPHTMLSAERARRVVNVVERELLTPYGLRSLSPNDPRYRGRYEGDTLSRDGAYHQGTVWAWLMGAFVTAYLNAHGRDAHTLRHASRLLEPFAEHLQTAAGLGHVSEIFDGDAPHHPRGCVAQAWSVAELLRAAGDCLPHTGQFRTARR